MIHPPQVRPEEPIAVTPHDGICGGESQQWLSYPTVRYTALFMSTVRSATATVQVRSAVLRITPTLMHHLLRQFPFAAVALHNVLAADVLSLADHLEQVGRHRPPLDRHPEP